MSVVKVTVSGKRLEADAHNGSMPAATVLREVWASLKSFQPKEKRTAAPPDDPGNPTVDFHNHKRLNETHESKTDPDEELRKGSGKEARLSYSDNLQVENRYGLIISAEVLEANGRARATRRW
jgi:hypothetical protein